jgi:hypothetical protein
MWISVKAGTTTRVAASWLDEGLMVFEGDLTCCAVLHNFGGIESARECKQHPASFMRSQLSCQDVQGIREQQLI